MRSLCALLCCHQVQKTEVGDKAEGEKSLSKTKKFNTLIHTSDYDTQNYSVQEELVYVAGNTR